MRLEEESAGKACEAGLRRSPGFCVWWTRKGTQKVTLDKKTTGSRAVNGLSLAETLRAAASGA